MRNLKLIVLPLFVSGVVQVQAQSVYPGQHGDKIKQQVTVAVKASAFDLEDVRLLDSRFRDNMRRDSAWLMSIPVKSLLHSFYNSAGAYTANEGGYSLVKKLGGWESLDCDLRGHTTGHILSALSYFYASTGEKAYKIKSDSIIDGLYNVQKAFAECGHNGYISAYPEYLINRNLAGTSVWAPWYTLHKIYSGLIDQYLYCNNDKALEIMNRAAGWAYDKLRGINGEQHAKMLRNEFGGVNTAFYNLYSITGNEKHKELAEFFYHAAVLDPLAQKNDDLYFKHANTFIPKLIGEARNYEMTGNERSKELSEFFWHTVVDHQTFCTGGNSHKEKFVHTDKLSENLTGYTQETCNTNNMLKLTRHLFCWDANPQYADFYERGLYNHILGQQDPQSGMVAYFLPLLPGAHKVYSTPDRSFWCCVGTGFENHAKYNEAIYYKTDKDLFVNLFIPSVVEWKEKNIRVTQNTAFPENGNVSLTVSAEKPARFALKLRYPAWSRDVVVRVNGKKQNIRQKPSSYISLDREWKEGDRIDVDYPMYLYVSETNDNPDKFAVMYGPLVLAGAMGTEGMSGKAPFSDPDQHNDYYTYDYQVPAALKTTLTIDKKNPEKSIKRIADNGLSFGVTGTGITLRPIHDIHHERYVVYWDAR